MRNEAEVLLIEDDPGDVDLTREALKTANAKINLHVVPDGTSALMYLKRQKPYHDAPRPDLIVLDLNLPRKNGREVLREIKSDSTLKSIPVIVLTTSESDSDISRCYDLGANCYFTKPLGFEDFIKVVRKIEEFWFSVAKLPPGGIDTPSNSIGVLLIEDDEADAVLIRKYLELSENVSFQVTNVERLSGGLELLEKGQFDIVMLDPGLPDSQGLESFIKVQEKNPKLPVIVMTGNDNDSIATHALQRGAQDYLVKGQVTKNLVTRSILYAIERKKLVTQLENSLKEIKVLQGLLPICMHCKKIRDDKGAWVQMESYISANSEAEFTHGLCSECQTRFYPGSMPNE